MADTIEKVETSIEGRERDDIGNSKEENQFNFGAGVHQEVDPRWKHPGEWQYEEDGMIVTRTSVWSAPGCHEGCGVLVYSDKETGRFIKCEGDPDDPYNRGALCPRCLAFKQVEFHPDRILYPMKRAGKRGENKWERISWDEALETCYKEFRRISMTYGGDSIHCLRGTARDNQWQVGRMANTFGSPNEYGFLSGTACYLPRLSLMIMTYGGMLIADFSQFSALRYDDPEWTCPECTIVWGCNPTISNPDFFMGHWVTDAMKLGCKLISVEPRVTWLAAHADIHLQLRPGTDTALALAMIKVIVDEDLYDHDFVERWTYGFDELAERARELSLDQVEEMTWVPKEKIVAAARMFANAHPANVVWGLAVDMQSQGTPCAAAIAALWTITGNLDIPGGMCYTASPMGVDQPSAGAWGIYDLINEDMQKKRVGWKEFPMYRYGLTQAMPDMCLEYCEAGKVKGIWIQTSNGIACMSCETERWYEAMKKVEFVAACDIFMTPTIQAYADIVMPVQTWAEKHSVRAHYYFLSAITGGCATEGEAKSDCEINRELAQYFDNDDEFNRAIERPEGKQHTWPWKTEDEVYDEIVKPSGFTFRELMEHGPAYQKYVYKKYEKGLMRPDGQPGFNTPTGRIEFWSTLFQKFGYDPLPYIEEPGIGPVTTPDLYKEYPMIMITGARTTSFFHSEHRQIPYLRQLTPDPWVQIHPRDAERLHICEGDWVWLENHRGRARQRARVTYEVHEGTIAAQHGWWFPEQDGAEPNLYGFRQSNINQLLANKPGTTGFGADLKCTLAKVYRCKEEEL